MNPKYCLALVIFSTYVSFASSSAIGQTSVQARTGTASAPVKTQRVHLVDCDTGRYTLTVDYERSTVSFASRRTAPVAIEQTSLGKLLIAKKLFGHLGFACVPDGIQVSFLGFEFDGGSPASVSFRGALMDDGTIQSETGLHAFPAEIVRQVWHDAAE